MRQLLYKEFRLALHPTAFVFLALSAMLLIPNYPYYVVFFYTTLGIFFICLTGRENNDILYSATLPVHKRDIVGSRIALTVILELAQLLLAIPFAILCGTFPMPGNQAGMDANIALFGLSLLMLGAFNLVFFRSYYAHPEKVGSAYLKGTIVFALLMILAESSTFFVPLFQAMDTPDPTNLPLKLVVLAVGAVCFAVFTLLAYRGAVRNFEKLDL